MKKLPSGRRKVNKIVEVKPDGKYTLCEDNGIGKVDKMYVMSSSQNNESLESIAKKRIEARNNPVVKSLDEYKLLRNSCHIIECVNTEFYCDCFIGIKGKICKHTMALMYDNDWFPVDDRLRSKKLNKRKRGAGRPAKVKPALNKTPPRNMIEEEEYLETGNEVAEIPVIDWNNELIDHSEIENHSIDSILFNIGNLVPTQDIPPPNFDSLPSTSFNSSQSVLSSCDQVSQTKTLVEKKGQYKFLVFLWKSYE